MRKITLALYGFLITTAGMWPAVVPSPAWAEEDKKSKVITIPLRTLGIPVVQHNEIMGYVLMDIFLEPVEPEDEAQITACAAKIRDAIFTDLYAVLGTLWLPTDKVTPEFLQPRIEKAIYKVIPKKFLKTITIKRLLMAPPQKMR